MDERRRTDSWWRPAPVEPVPAPTAAAERTTVWCTQTLWDEGEFLCQRPKHPPGTLHWYDIRKASQVREEESA